MPVKTEAQIIKSMEDTISSVSPQIRVDADKGPLFYTNIRSVAPLLADASAETERLALISTFQFPENVTPAEMTSTARAFGVGLGDGGFAFGLVFALTGRRPAGNETFTIAEGDVLSTSSSIGTPAVTFAVAQTRVLNSTNIDSFYNPTNRRFEVPVLARALTAGPTGNVAPGSISKILSGSTAATFDGVTNYSAFTGGTDARAATDAYQRVQAKLTGLDQFSRGGLLSTVLETDVDNIQTGALTYGSEYPTLFYRLPDGPAVDVWLLHTPISIQAVESFIATAGQTIFSLGTTPVLGLQVAAVNGTSVTATLEIDTTLALGGSTRETSAVVLSTPTTAGDTVDITYTYDAVIATAQATVDGYLQSDTGALYSTDVLVRSARTLDVVIHVSATALATFDRQSVADDISSVVGTFLTQGLGTVDALGGTRSAADLRDRIRTEVPGINLLSIPVFCRKAIGSIVETIDIPRNAYPIFALSTDLQVSVT